jgi:hypothetical protein
MERKKVLFRLVCLMALLIQPAEVRAVDFGIKAGLNLATQTDPGVIQADYRLKPDFSAGLFCSFRCIGRLMLQPEIHFSREGFSSSDSHYGVPVENDWQISYLKMPLLLRLNFRTGAALRPAVLFGPYLAARLSAKRIQDGFDSVEEEDATDKIWPGDYGLILACQLATQAGNGEIGLELRFSYGLANTLFKSSYNDWVDAPDDPASARNRVFSLMISYEF